MCSLMVAIQLHLKTNVASHPCFVIQWKQALGSKKSQPFPLINMEKCCLTISFSTIALGWLEKFGPKELHGQLSLPLLLMVQKVQTLIVYVVFMAPALYSVVQSLFIHQWRSVREIFPGRLISIPDIFKKVDNAVV